MADPGRPQGGAKSEAGRAAYWRMQYESAIGALADLIAEHTETVEAFTDLRAKVEGLPVHEFDEVSTYEGDRTVVTREGLCRRDVLDLFEEKP